MSRIMELFYDTVCWIEEQLLMKDSKGKWSGRDSDGVERQHECGVGLELEKNSVGEWVIAGLRPGGPAYNSGQLHVGMRVDSLDWRSIRGLSQFEVQRALYGPLGSVLTLEICASADDPMLGALRRHVTLVRFPGDQAVRPERCCTAAAAPSLSCCAPCKNCLQKMREAA